MPTTPFFELDIKKLRENYEVFRKSLEKSFPNNKIAYSIKTNSLPQVIQELINQGSGMEAASLKELKAALSLKAGFIVLNGPAKTSKEIRLAQKNKVIIHADSYQELDWIAENAPEAIIGLRLNYGVNKFGFDDIEAAVGHAKARSLSVISLHSHPGTRVSLDKYKEYAKYYAENARKALDAGASLQYYDVGGGFLDYSSLASQRTNWENYFNEMQNTFKKYGLRGTLVVEPGRALVADAMELVATVRCVKQVRGVNYAILDAGINYLSPITLAHYEIVKNHESKTKEENKNQYTVAGPLLFSNDKICFYHGDLQAGEVMRVKNAGAYCLNLAWEISYGKPKIIVKET